MKDFGLFIEETETFPIYKNITMMKHYLIEVDIDDDDKGNAVFHPIAHIGLLCQITQEADSDAITPGLMVEIFKVLGDSSRFSILNCLLNRPTIGRELARELELAPATISQHISKLISEDLVIPKLERNHTYYSVNSDKISKTADALRAHFCSADKKKVE